MRGEQCLSAAAGQRVLKVLASRPWRSRFYYALDRLGWFGRWRIARRACVSGREAKRCITAIALAVKQGVLSGYVPQWCRGQWFCRMLHRAAFRDFDFRDVMSNFARLTRSGMESEVAAQSLLGVDVLWSRPVDAMRGAVVDAGWGGMCRAVYQKCDGDVGRIAEIANARAVPAVLHLGRAA